MSGIDSTTVDNQETGTRLLRITCSDHGILSETGWEPAELCLVGSERNLMDEYLQHVVGAHREPYGANCGGDVNAEIFEGDRAPVTIVWKISTINEHYAPELIGVFATPGDADRWIEQQRHPDARFEATDYNVLHFTPEPMVPANHIDPEEVIES